MSDIRSLIDTLGLLEAAVRQKDAELTDSTSSAEKASAFKQAAAVCQPIPKKMSNLNKSVYVSRGSNRYTPFPEFPSIQTKEEVERLESLCKSFGLQLESSQGPTDHGTSRASLKKLRRIIESKETLPSSQAPVRRRESKLQVSETISNVYSKIDEIEKCYNKRLTPEQEASLIVRLAPQSSRRNSGEAYQAPSSRRSSVASLDMIKNSEKLHNAHTAASLSKNKSRRLSDIQKNEQSKVGVRRNSEPSKTAKIQWFTDF